MHRGGELAAFCFEYCDFAIKHFRLYYHLVSPQHSDTVTLFKENVCLGFALWKDMDQDIDWEASYWEGGSFTIKILHFLLQTLHNFFFK